MTKKTVKTDEFGLNKMNGHTTLRISKDWLPIVETVQFLVRCLCVCVCGCVWKNPMLFIFLCLFCFKVFRLKWFWQRRIFLLWTLTGLRYLVKIWFAFPAFANVMHLHLFWFKIVLDLNSIWPTSNFEFQLKHIYFADLIFNFVSLERKSFQPRHSDWMLRSLIKFQFLNLKQVSVFKFPIIFKSWNVSFC